MKIEKRTQEVCMCENCGVDIDLRVDARNGDIYKIGYACWSCGHQEHSEEFYLADASQSILVQLFNDNI